MAFVNIIGDLFMGHALWIITEWILFFEAESAEVVRYSTREKPTFECFELAVKFEQNFFDLPSFRILVCVSPFLYVYLFDRLSSPIIFTHILRYIVPTCPLTASLSLIC